MADSPRAPLSPVPTERDKGASPWFPEGQVSAEARPKLLMFGISVEEGARHAELGFTVFKRPFDTCSREA